MKKIISIVSMIFFVIYLPFQQTKVSATSLNNDLKISANYSHTKKTSVTIFVGYGSFPPAYSSVYRYNDGLYSGVLHESYSERRPGGGIGDKMYAWYVTYSGYVTSNSGQPIPSKYVEE
ncbi:hypothetical protein [Ignavigranum ruoffiae]|uniref:hypothetical protein n=1 Tax=Ignavigranum ruoffiae TaxID=89093 RepID=UPI0024ACFA11|nr:hypothetical protein [Ignavigranum ruoffiae]